MDDRQRVQHSRSFDSVADAYDRARPSYPGTAVSWLLGAAPLRVLDLAAGTGAFTRPLLEAGHIVLAADHLPSMLAHLRRRSSSPALAVVAASAEQLPLRDATFDAITVAQAYHWFDEASAVPELARVLRPGGVLALLWNQRDRTIPWVRRLGELMGSDDLHPDPSGTLGLSGFFGAVEWRRFRLYQPLNRDGLIDLVRSRSYVAVLGDAERQRLLRRVGELYDEQRGDSIGLQMPYWTHCLRVTRLSG